MPKEKIRMTEELPEMPDRDEVGQAAVKVVEITRKIKALLFDKGERMEDLRDAMIRADRKSITVEGVTFVLETKEAEEKVRAIWPK